MFADGLDKKHEKCVETSDSTLLAGTTGRIELTWVRLREEQIEGRKQVFRLVHLKASWLFGGRK